MMTARTASRPPLRSFLLPTVSQMMITKIIRLNLNAIAPGSRHLVITNSAMGFASSPPWARMAQVSMTSIAEKNTNQT